MQNGFVESFDGKFRDACLNKEIFGTLAEARAVIEHWRVNYNPLAPALGSWRPHPRGSAPEPPLLAGCET